MGKSTSEPVSCEHCQHYRPQIGFVDAWKRIDHSPPRGPLMKSLQDTRRAETEALENEVELLFELVRSETWEWVEEPRFAPYCGHNGTVVVAALKNQGGRCTDFQQARNRASRGCHSCYFRTPPSSRIGDRHESLQGWMNEGTRNHVTQRNKEKEDADASAMGLEIEQSFYADGLLPVVKYLPTCGAKRKNGQSFVVPFANLRSQCSEHKPWLNPPPALLLPHYRSAPSALDLTFRLTEVVLSVGQKGPAAFVEAVRPLVSSHPELGRWVRVGVARWAKGRAVSTQLMDALAEGSERTLIPTIAGADAFEWGWLAEMSHNDPLRAAKIAAQQIYEYLAATVRPDTCVAAIDAFEKLAISEVFHPHMREEVDTLLRRLLATRDDATYAICTDLIGYYEQCAARLLYSVGRWLRARPPETEIDGSMFGGAMNFTAPVNTFVDQVIRKAQIARADGHALLQRIAIIESPSAQPSAANMIESIADKNARALDDDIKAQKGLVGSMLSVFGMQDMVQGVEGPQQALSQLFGVQLPGANPIEAAINRLYEPVKRSELPRRHLLAWLLFTRGTLSTTPSALDFYSNKQPSSWLPATGQLAILEPAERNLESTYAVQEYNTYLAASRRVPSPMFLEDQ